jgi:hypothetical protein
MMLPFLNSGSNDTPNSDLGNAPNSSWRPMKAGDLVLVEAVGICPQINHMKLNEHTWRLLFIAKRAYRTL